MNNKLKTGLVVLNYNDYKTTIKLIKMIKDYKSIDLIVIVDNCSTDKSYKKINEYTNNKVKLIKSDKNGGYAYGNNFGIHYLIENHKCDIIFTNNIYKKGPKGPEMLSKLWDIEGFNIPVVIHTISDNERYYFIDVCGFDEYVVKPLSQEKIKPILDKFLGSR